MATAAPNGYTIGAGVNSISLSLHVSGSTVPFNIETFLLIGNYATDVSVLAVHPDAPWQSFEQLIDDARRRPGMLTYASAGVRDSLIIEHAICASAFDLVITPVPFGGGAQSTMAVMGRHVNIGMMPCSTGAEMLREHKLRPLLTTAATQTPSLPDVPTLSEKGLPTERLSTSFLGCMPPRRRRATPAKALIEALARTMTEAAVVANLDKASLFALYEKSGRARTRLDEEFRDIVALDRKLKQRQ